MLWELSVSEQRYRAVLEVLAGVPVTEVAGRYGVSRQSVHGWLGRYRGEGPPGLADRSHRVRAHPWQIPAELESAVCELRRAHPKWGPKRLVFEMGRRGHGTVTRSTVYREGTDVGLQLIVDAGFVHGGSRRNVAWMMIGRAIDRARGGRRRDLHRPARRPASRHDAMANRRRTGPHSAAQLRREVKTETSEAPLPLPDLCIAALKIRRKQQDADRARAGDYGWVDYGLVFTTRHGTPIEPRNFGRSFDRCITAARVPRITVHGTRKTCASLLAALDVHPRVAMRILRHSKIAVTMEIYTEAPSDATRDALRKLSDWLT